MLKRALVVGASGIVGSAAAEILNNEGWQVSGLARKPVAQPGVAPIAADLLDLPSLSAALAGVNASHVFITTWLRQKTEAENIRVNAAMVRNLLDALRPAGSVRHVALTTGLKHYLGPFESYGKGKLPQTPFREEQGRLDVENFYYAQEDQVFDAAHRDGFTWSVHRPHTIIGKAVGAAMNMGTTLAVYATICKVTGRPFRFPGVGVQWNSLTDMTDARLLGRHMLWAATTPAAANQDFQCRQRRHFPLELDVGPHRRLVRYRSRSFRRCRSSARTTNVRRRCDLARYCDPAQSGGERTSAG